ncbi:uncharacterized protein LOC142348137 [Convolutriloba macropyga]|uniref:uncharacterized protein LOC142348137 n=1 Tax=Convolutriloba macropyga TaxID=536237 RepID=UPI003F526839
MFSENNLLKEACPAVSLNDLPTNVLQYLCQLLIDSLWRGSGWVFLRDVMNMRSTSVYFRDVINDLVLYLPCYVCDSWLTANESKNYSKSKNDLINFLNFMKTETNWRFCSVNVLYSGEEFNITPLLCRFEALFTNNINNVTLLVTKINYISINRLVQWLARGALKSQVKFKVTFIRSVSILENPTFVSDAVFLNSLEYSSGLESENFIRNLSSYSNLRKLDIPHLEFKIENLELFPSLTSLQVKHLVVSNYRVVKNLPCVTDLLMRKQEGFNSNLLPLVINKCFPHISYLQLGALRYSVINGDFCLPECCHMLKISLSLLQKFKDCHSVKCLRLFLSGKFGRKFSSAPVWD